MKNKLGYYRFKFFVKVFQINVRDRLFKCTEGKASYRQVTSVYVK